MVPAVVRLSAGQRQLQAGRAAVHHAQRHPPVLLVQVAGRTHATALVARRGPRRHVQHPVAHGRVDLEHPGQVGPPAGTGAQQCRRGGRDHQLGRRTEAVVHLLPRGRVEGDDELHPACGDLRHRAVGGVREAVRRLPGRQRHPGQPVRGRLDHHQVVPDHDGGTGLGQPGGQGVEPAVGPPAHGAVVGVEDRDRSVGQHGHAERVLQQRLVGRAVTEAEVEQPRPDVGDHPAVLHVPQARGLAVGQPQPVPVGGQPGGLGEPRLGQRSVQQSFMTGARSHPGRAGARVEGPQPVGARHRDPDPIAPPDHVPGARQPVRRGAGGQGEDAAVGEPDPPQRVVDRVGHHHVVPGLAGHLGRQQAQPVGLVEAGLLRPAVTVPPLARTDPTYDGPGVGGQLDQVVVTGVGHQEAVAEGDHRRGEPQALAVVGSTASLSGRRRARAPRPQRPALPVGRGQLRDQGRDGVHVTLAGVLRHDVPLRVDQHQGGPGPGRVGLPGHQVGVVEHGVGHLVALHRGGQGVGVGLVDELRRVHADHHELLGVLLLQRAELLQDVQAVDAAEGPEVQEQEAAAKSASERLSPPVPSHPRPRSSGARTRGRRPVTTGAPRSATGSRGAACGRGYRGGRSRRSRRPDQTADTHPPRVLRCTHRGPME